MPLTAEQRARTIWVVYLSSGETGRISADDKLHALMRANEIWRGQVLRVERERIRHATDC
jgi:hypothetical protein